MPETATVHRQESSSEPGFEAPAPVLPPVRCRVAVIWIDWYAYHVARFLGLAGHPELAGAVAGIELVGGIGVHAGLRFREDLPRNVGVETLFPDSNWHDAGQWRLAQRLWQRLGALDPEVVLVPGYYTLPAIAAALWARLYGRKSVLMTESTRGDHRRSRGKETLKGLLIRALFNWAVAGGSRHASYLADLGFAAGRVRRFYDVVDNEGLYRQAQRWRRGLRGTDSADAGLPSQYFLYVGRLAPEKNLSGPGGLLAAYLAHRGSGGRWPLVLVGDGPERAALMQQAANSPFAKDVFFIGHKGSEELPRFYAFASCSVLPSTREPWGLVVNEAMACGLPVIVSTRCGCADDLVTPLGNGLLFDPELEGALTDALAAIEALRPEQLARMGSQSLSNIAAYSPARFGEQIAEIVNA